MTWVIRKSLLLLFLASFVWVGLISSAVEVGSGVSFNSEPIATSGLVNRVDKVVYLIYVLDSMYYAKNASSGFVISSNILLVPLLNEVVNARLKNGEAVLIQSGDYILDSKFTITKSNVTIILENGATVTAKAGLNETMIYANGLIGLVIKGEGTIDGNKGNQVVSDTYNDVGSGIVLWGVSYSTVQDIEIRNCSTRGIIVRTGAHHNTLRNLRVNHCGKSDPGGRYDNIVLNGGFSNSIEDCIAQYPYRDNIVVYKEHDSVVRNCVCRGPADSAGAGIMIDGQGSSAAYNILVENCLIENVLDSFIGFSYEGSVHSVTVRNCTLRRTNTTPNNHGILIATDIRPWTVQNITIEDCSIENMYLDGIRIGRQGNMTSTISQIAIRNTEVFNNLRNGIEIYAGTGSVSDITISGCYVHDNNYNRQAGYCNVLVQGSSYVTIHNSTINNIGTNNNYEVKLDDNSNYCTIINNNLYGIHTAAISQGSGIGHVISNNQF